MYTPGRGSLISDEKISKVLCILCWFRYAINVRPFSPCCTEKSYLNFMFICYITFVSRKLWIGIDTIFHWKRDPEVSFIKIPVATISSEVDQKIFFRNFRSFHLSPSLYTYAFLIYERKQTLWLITCITINI